MASLIIVFSLGFFGLNSAESLPGSWSLRPSPFGPIGGGLLSHRLGFLEVQPKPSKEVLEHSPVRQNAVKPSSKPHSNHSAIDDIMHPKVEYDPETAALMAQADDAIKEAENVDKAPPSPASKKVDKDEVQNLGMMKALRGMVCGHKLKKHLSLCDLKEFQGAEIKSEVHQAVIPEPTEDSAPSSESDSVSDRADDLLVKIDHLQHSVAASHSQDSQQALLDVVHSASKVRVSTTRHTTGAEAAALMKSDVTANLPADVRDTILSVMHDTKSTNAEVHSATQAMPMNADVTASLPASVRDTVLAVMKNSKH